MPIARRQSHNALPAQSGIHRAAEIDFDDEDIPSASIPLATPPGPKRYRSMEMPAVRPEAAAPSAPGRVLDASIFDDLEPPLGLGEAAGDGDHDAPAVWSRSGSGLHRVEAVRPKDPRPGIVAFAGYGLPPEGLAGTPAYALRVWRRRLSLRSDLRIARMRSLPQRDIDLYEAAIACADEAAMTKGILLVTATLAGALSAIAAVVAAVF